MFYQHGAALYNWNSAEMLIPMGRTLGSESSGKFCGEFLNKYIVDIFMGLISQKTRERGRTWNLPEMTFPCVTLGPTKVS